jgi:hypothetical protein
MSGLNPEILGLMASTLTITPLREYDKHLLHQYTHMEMEEKMFFPPSEPLSFELLYCPHF